MPAIARKGRGSAEYLCGESAEVNKHGEYDTTSETVDND